MRFPRQFVWAFRVLLSHYVRHPLQAATMAVGLVTGVSLWSAVELINDHARASYAEADQLLGAEARYWVRPVGEVVDPADYIALRRAGFTSVYPVIERRVRLASGEGISIIATDLLALPVDSATASNPFAATDWTSLVRPPFEAWYSPSLAQALSVAEGDQLPLSSGTRLPPAVIGSQTGQGHRVFMDVGAALGVLDMDGFSYLGVGAARDVDALRARLPPGLRLVENSEALDLAQLTASLHTNLAAMGLLSFAVGLFIVFNAVRFSLNVRRYTITTLRELGVSVGVLSSAIAFESFIWAVIATVGGLLCGQWLGNALLPAVASSMQNLYGVALGPQVDVGVERVFAALALTGAGVTMALALPLIQKVREPVLAARADSERWRKDERAVRRQAQAALALGLLGAIGWPLMFSVETGFVVLGLVTFAGALLLPMILEMCMRAIRSVAGESRWRLRWSVSDAFSQLPQLRVALMALLLTLTANVGVTTLVDSFRTALSGWLETRLSATVYVQSESLDVEALAGAPWLDALHERLGIETRFRDRSASVRGLTPDAPDVRGMGILSAVPAARERWSVGDGIFASEQVRHLANVDAGETIELDGHRFEVLGFFHDYGNVDYAFYLPKEKFEAAWPVHRREGVALWFAPPAREVAIDALVAAGAEPGDWAFQDDVKQVALQIFDRTFAITAALNSLTLMVAGVALLAALVSLHQSRLPEYGQWRAMGLHFREWLVIVALPLALLVAVTWALSLPMGALLSWLLVHELNVMAFGWTMPLVWSWTPAFVLAGITAGIVAVTLLVAVVRVRRALPVAVRLLMLLSVVPTGIASEPYSLLRHSPEGYASVVPGKVLTFPADHLPHPAYRIEWWYLTANLNGADGEDYGVHWTLFRQSMTPDGDPEGWSSNQVWMAHAAVHLPSGHVYEERFARGGIGQAGVVVNDDGQFNAWLDDWHWIGEGASPLPGELEFTVGEVDVTLHLSADTPWVLQGDGGYSQKSAGGQASYYYSQPHIEIVGEIRAGNAAVAVDGAGWLDREWSSQPLAADQPGWDWLSLHLDDGHALMVYQLRHENGDNWVSGSWVAPDGSSTTLAKGDVVFEPLSTSSVRTGPEETRQLPLEWRVALPAQGLEWKVRALAPDSWLDTAFPYWEGPMRVEGSTGGSGYLELTGY